MPEAPVFLRGQGNEGQMKQRDPCPDKNSLAVPSGFRGFLFSGLGSGNIGRMAGSKGSAALFGKGKGMENLRFCRREHTAFHLTAWANRKDRPRLQGTCPENEGSIFFSLSREDIFEFQSGAGR